jgi:hypothetical protein
VKSNTTHRWHQRLYLFLGGGELALILFVITALVIIPGTFEIGRSWYSSPLFKGLLGLLMLNLFLCTVQRWRRLKWPILLLHGGVIVIMAGALLTSFGYVATVNIFEGGMTNVAYRWDLEQDVPLGYDLAVDSVHREYFPIPVQVGVLRGEEKFKLFTLKTGESFDLGEYKVRVETLDLQRETLLLTVLKSGQSLGTASTSGETNLPAGFPFSFKLVAFKNPVLQKIWVNLKLFQGEKLLAQGPTRINSPFQWGGLHFYNTLIDKTPAGLPFAGIQIVNDPGRPLVFAGFILVGLGAMALFLRRLYANS